MDVSDTLQHVSLAERRSILVPSDLGRPRVGAGHPRGHAERWRYDVTRPDAALRGAVFTALKLLVVKIARRALEARVGKAREMVVRPIRPVNPESV